MAIEFLDASQVVGNPEYISRGSFASDHVVIEDQHEVGSGLGLPEGIHGSDGLVGQGDVGGSLG